MSGTIGDNVYRASGVIASAAAGGISWQDVVTGSTLTAVAGNGYPIDTTSNACTITLPASASVGDEIIFTDYARNWGTNAITIDSNGLNYQGDDDSYTVEYTTAGQSVHIVYMDATNGWIPTLDKAVADAPSKPNQEGIFAYGYTSGLTAISNKVSSAGVVASDVTGVGTARQILGACEYGTDKGIFGFGYDGSPPPVSMTNLVTNLGVIGTDVTGVGTGAQALAAATYGGTKGIFAFGMGPTGYVSTSHLISDTGVCGNDVTGVGTARGETLAACEYSADKDKAIFGFGYIAVTYAVSITNLVSNTGVVASDQAATTGTARWEPAACGYGGDKGIFGFGNDDSSVVGMTNLVSNLGVVATDVAAVGTARQNPSATQYDYDKGIFGFGTTGSVTAVTNLVSNAGVVASDVTGVGSARSGLRACSFN